MADVDRIIEQLLADRRTHESALFSSRTFADQPIIERGRDLQERLRSRERARTRSHDLQDRMRQRGEERAERHQQAAEERKARRQHQAGSPSEPERPSQPTTAQPRGQQPAGSTRLTQPADAEESLRMGMCWSSLWPTPSVRPTRSTSDSAPSRRPIPFDLPEPIRRMRQLEGATASNLPTYGQTASAKLFYEQARLMEDYEDDFVYDGGFFQYFPTYATMSNEELRGYFGWRTRVRSGTVENAPLSFAFVYIYELLCGVGTTPGPQGLADLHAFGKAYQQASPYDGERLMRYLRAWTRDYAVYHNISSELPSSPDDGTNQAALALLAAEHAQLRAAELGPRVGSATVDTQAPSPEELFHALSDASTYRLDQSRLAKDEGELLIRVATDVFAGLVTHCARRRKVDFVEGLFGFAYNVPYTMFASAIFYEPTPHPDCRVQISPAEAYVCSNGRWRHEIALEVTARNSELGRYLHEIDYELRQLLDYAYPLKSRSVPKYVRRMIQKAAAARIKEREEAEAARRRAEEEAQKRRITIDRSKLAGIRSAAAQTREALLTDEERGMEPAPVMPAPLQPARPTGSLATAEAPSPHPSAPLVSAAAAPGAAVQTSLAGAVATAETPVPHADRPSATAAPTPGAPGDSTPAEPPAAATRAACEAVATYGLTELELRVLEGLLAHVPASALLSPGDAFVSVVVDSINEKLFDLVGDTLIEFDGDEPSVIEDYLDDIREVL